MVRVVSMRTARETVGGSEVSSCGSRARTWSTVSMMLAPGCLNTGMRMAGTPLEMPRLRTFSTESFTSATSESRRAVPRSKARTRGRYSAAECSWSVALSDQVFWLLSRLPLARLILALARVARTSSRLSPWLLRMAGFTSTRTAGRAPPHTKICPTPGTWDSFWPMTDEAMSYIFSRGTILEVMERMRIGASAGFTLRYEGLFGRLEGRLPRAALMAAWTSRAAASIFRLRSNCRVMLVEPSVLEEVISVTPAMRPNCRSRGVATEEAMVSGLAPGREEETWMVGNSTWGSGATGRN